MTALRGMLGFVVFVIVFLLTLFLANIVTVGASAIFTGWDRFWSQLWGAVVASAVAVTMAKVALDRIFKKYPARAIASVFMVLNALLIADYLLLIPRAHWNGRFWPEIVQDITAIFVVYQTMWNASSDLRDAEKNT